MWYEENEQFVRAPTPQGFDDLVQDLEARDSVVFESIQLPSSKNGTRQSMNSTRSSTISTTDSHNLSQLGAGFETKKQTTIQPIEEETPFELSDSFDSFDEPLPATPTNKVYSSTNSFRNSIELGSTMNSLEVSNDDLRLSTSSPNLLHLRSRVEELKALNKQKDDEIIQKDIEINQLKAQVDAQDPRISSRLNYKELYENVFLELTKLKEALRATPAKRKIGTRL